MNINDIDRLGKLSVDGTNFKTFYKVLSGSKLLGIEAGGIIKNCGEGDCVYLAFDLENEDLIREYHVHNQRIGDSEKMPYRVAFSCSSKAELRNFIQALEFACGVLKQGEAAAKEWAF